MMARRLVVGLVFFGLAFGLAGTARAATDLNLLGGRFQVSAKWRTVDGGSGTAQAVPLTAETGFFWFFSPANVELVVKVHDACVAPFNSFWVFASGLTNVEVELTVEDTWTGEVKTYLRPGGSLFAPLADTSTFDGCGALQPCGQGTSEQIAATPRPNAEAEALALLLGPGITADPEIYARLDADLARIRALDPSLSAGTFKLIWWPSSLLVELTPAAFDALQAGKFKEWDCLNAWYGLKDVYVVSRPYVSLEFEGFFHAARIGVDYTALPGVVRTEPNWVGYPATPLPGDVCVSIDGTAYDYFIEAGNFRTWYFRVPHAGAAPVVLGNAPGFGDPRPEWWTRYQQCRANLSEASSR
jgi:hypothetical protein